MAGLLKILAFVWVSAGLIGFLGGCAIGGYEAYGGVRSIDSRTVTESMRPAEKGFSDRLWQMLGADAEKQNRRA